MGGARRQDRLLRPWRSPGDGTAGQVPRDFDKGRARFDQRRGGHWRRRGRAGSATAGSAEVHMKNPGRSLLAVLALVSLGGCMTGRGTAPASLAGGWSFQLEPEGRVTRGQMRLVPAANGYQGTLTTDRGGNLLPVRSFTLDGAAIRMHVESPQGAVTFAGTLAPDARTFAGTVTYHDGRRFPMRATRE